MRRWQVGTACVVFGLLAVAPIAWGQPAPAARPVMPNIVLILADDLGIGEVGAYGQREIQTPSIDRLAVQGLRFRQFYSANPLCAPARCALMTGRHVGHCRVWGNDVDYLRPDDVTMAEVLKAGGYATGAFGKWGLSFNDKPESFPTSQGFDEFFGFLDQRHAHNYFPTFLVHNAGERVPLPNVVPDERKYGEGDASVEKVYADDVIAERALEWVKANKDKRFFLYYTPTLPHINNEGAKAADGGFEVPDLGPYKDKDWPLPKKAYAAMITRLDANVGRLMALLDELKIADRTLVMFTSDNGATFLKSANDGRTNVVGDWFNGRGPYRGYKYDVYEGGVRVPTIVRWPGRIKPGSVTDEIGYFPDLLPTFASLAGLIPPKGGDGISLGSLLLGQDRPLPKRDFLYWYAVDWPSEAVREGRWKAVWTKKNNALVAELFDLEADPGEQANVSEAHPDVMARLDAIRKREGSQRTPILELK